MNWTEAAHKYLGLAGESWQRWVALVAVLLCQSTPEQQALVAPLIQRSAPLKPPREAWWAIGRRGGKDYVAARLAVFLALFRQWTLAPGEVGVVLVMAVDKAQAKVAFRYVLGALEAHPMLWAEVANVTADVIVFRNGIELQVTASDHASVRGRTVLAAILDEFAFYPYEQATELLRALRPAQATQPNSLLIVISSAYAARGPFHETRRASFGKEDPHILFAVASTQDMNPTIDPEFIAAEMARDPVAAAAEFFSIERTDCESFLDVALVDRATRTEPRDLPYFEKDPSGTYVLRVGAVDVSGGRSDATAAAVAHMKDDTVVIDACRRWPSPHDPKQVAKEVAEFLESYGLSMATADQYGAGLTLSIYSEAGVTLIPAEVNRSEAYLACLPLFTSGRVEIPDDPRLRTELLGLERRTGRNGKDAVDHVPNQHDDLANAVCLAAWRAFRPDPLGNVGVEVIESDLCFDMMNELR